jgi:hypothetical protein
MTNTHAMHQPKICEVDGNSYAYCRLQCGWAGPWRRWTWRARRDAHRHLAAMRQISR